MSTILKEKYTRSEALVFIACAVFSSLLFAVTLFLYSTLGF